MDLRRTAGLAFVAFAATVHAPAARAATTTFDPDVSLDATYTDNVRYLPETSSPTADWFSRLAFALPVRREGARGSFGFEYDPSFVRYRDNGDLDHDEHRLAVDARSVGRRQTLGFAGGWERSQTQGAASGLVDPDPFVVPRSEQDRYHGEVTFERQAGERWSWNTAARGDRTVYAPIAESEATLENRTTWEALLAARRAFTASSSGGVEYRFERYMLDLTGDEDDHLLGLTWNLDAGRDASFAFRIGAFHRNPKPAPGYEDIDTGKNDGVQGRIQAERRYRRNAIRFEVEHGPSSGGGLSGTSTDTVSSLTFTGARERRWQWATTARWAKRRPTRTSDPTITTSGASASTGWNLGPHWELSISAEYVKQTADTETVPDTTYSTYTGGLIWHPRGPARPSGGGRG